jgi:hypothetical protein
MVRRLLLLLLAIWSSIVVGVGTVGVRSAAAAKEDCKNDLCVWSQPEYAGKLTKVTSKCQDRMIRSAANTTTGGARLRFYTKQGCTGANFSLGKGTSTPNIHAASAKAE